MDKVIEKLEAATTQTVNGLPRKIDENLTIRNGPHGDYIFYKRVVGQTKISKINRL